MTYHFKNCVDISIFHEDMAFLVRQGETCQNRAFLAVSWPSGTTQFTKMNKIGLFSLIFTHFFQSGSFKAIRQKQKNRTSEEDVKRPLIWAEGLIFRPAVGYFLIFTGSL